MNEVDGRLRENPADLILQRLPGAAWRTLPHLVVVGVLFLAASLGGTTVGGYVAPFTSVLVAIVCALPLDGAIRRLSRELFELTHTEAGGSRRIARSAVFVVVPGLLLALSSCAAVAAEAEPIFSAFVAGGYVLSTVAVMVAMVALPLAVARPEARVRSVLTVAFYSTLRRPLPPFAAMFAAAAATWAAAVWLPGALILVPLLAAALAVGAAWTVLPSAGVRLPALSATPTRPRIARADSR